MINETENANMMLMKNISSLLVLTGSGVSVESGLSSFRTNNGLWNTHRIEDVCTVEAFEKNSSIVHDFYNELRSQMNAAKPNPSHFAISMLQHELPNIKINVITQNVDLLHEKAGTKNVYHIHGRIDEAICMNCGHIIKVGGDIESDDVCPNCNVMGMMKENIVFFGEMPHYMNEVEQMLEECDMFIAIGTSGIVAPASTFVRTAKLNGARKTYLFNLEPAANAKEFDETIYGDCTETFVKFAEQLVANNRK